ncbi:MAG: peptide chain release factor N(5)-glutamine methyltransferase, partial [Candidatus Omnitrophica bacterium]|nr:peptide chain release factor N(5)-glutamine methyltransferase [Candidatus Omnitrophota bacterium]
RDISEDALTVAGANAGRLGAAGRVEFVCCDLFPPDAEKFDLIVSNPPYVKSTDIAELQPEVRREPRPALDGGPDGLDAFRRIIPGAGKALNAIGCLMLEIGYDQRADVTRLIEKTEFFNVEDVVKDYNGIDRVLVARRREE